MDLLIHGVLCLALLLGFAYGMTTQLFTVQPSKASMPYTYMGFIIAALVAGGLVAEFFLLGSDIDQQKQVLVQSALPVLLLLGLGTGITLTALELKHERTFLTPIIWFVVTIVCMGVLFFVLETPWLILSVTGAAIMLYLFGHSLLPDLNRKKSFTPFGSVATVTSIVGILSSAQLLAEVPYALWTMGLYFFTFGLIGFAVGVNRDRRKEPLLDLGQKAE